MSEPRTNTGNLHGDNDGDGRSGLTHSVRPGVACPETVLAAVLSDGSYLLVGHPHGEPAAFIAADDAALMRQALTTAFGHPNDAAVSADSRRPRVGEAQP